MDTKSNVVALLTPEGRAHLQATCDRGPRPRAASIKTARNGRAERARRKRVELGMAAIAQRSFSAAFNEMFELCVAERTPRSVKRFETWFLGAMNACYESYKVSRAVRS